MMTPMLVYMFGFLVIVAIVLVVMIKSVAHPNR